MTDEFKERWLHITKPGSTDISDHLETLRYFAFKCDSVTEFGFRDGNSFQALIKGLSEAWEVFYTNDIHIPSATTYDIRLDRRCFQWLHHHSKLGRNCKAIEADTLKIEIEPTDFLFIDTFHTYDQLKKELEIHGNKAQKYLGFHDTETYGRKGEDGRTPGLMDAIEEFLTLNPHWQLECHYRHNNGLTILKRIS